jgi:hypothetical protein
VETEGLALLVEAFVTDRRNNRGYHPVTWLAGRTRDADPLGKGISADRISKLIRREREYTDLTVADALLVAMGCIEALYDGTVEIMANPARPGCCQLYPPSPLAWALCR